MKAVIVLLLATALAALGALAILDDEHRHRKVLEFLPLVVLLLYLYAVL